MTIVKGAVSDKIRIAVLNNPRYYRRRPRLTREAIANVLTKFAKNRHYHAITIGKMGALRSLGNF